MPLTTPQRWRRTIAWLHRNFPAQYAVSVRSKPLKKICGCTKYFGEWFLIEINRKQSHLLRMDTLFHEWAHALTWFGPETNEDHSAEWGIAYARIYRTYLEWNFGREGRIDDA